MIERHEVLRRLKIFEARFQSSCSISIYFEPEYRCAKAINEKLEDLKCLTRKDAEEILKIYNETNSGEHYDGSAWFDFQLHLRMLFKHDNLIIENEKFSTYFTLHPD